MESIDDIVDRARQALEGVPEDDEDRWRNLAEFGGLLDWAWSQTKSMQYLEEAIEVSETVVKITAEKGLITNQADFLATLHSLWLEKYHETHEIMDLDKSIEAAQKAADLTPEEDIYKASRLSELSHRIHTKYKRLGRLSDLQEAIQSAEQAIEASPGIHSEATRAGWRSDLAFLVTARFRHTGESKDLEDGICYAREAVEVTPADHRERSNRLNNLGHVLYSRYMYTGRCKDLEEAINLARDAIDAFSATLPPDHPSGLDRRFNLATLDAGGLDEAIGFAREAQDAFSGPHIRIDDKISRIIVLHNLLDKKYSRTGAMSDLETVILAAKEAVNVTPTGHEQRPELLDTLSHHLDHKYFYTRTTDDLRGSHIGQHAAITWASD
ncbi:putative 30S ribosomal protein S17-like protein [Colletotrichum sp. SAR 10_98]|nr:putative 30S ribosomal protein S17-like protein [Colletotrichum sp. SAR 10_98]